MEKSTIIAAPPAFTAFRFGGLKFIAIPIDRGNIHVLDDTGKNYGSWMDMNSFKRNFRECLASAVSHLTLGKARLAIRILDN